ncbi:MAG: copper-binding protein [Nitrosarchaeum sp.]|nr:copper-binding protein [Nitrosarchaeum sp.]
MSNWDLMMPGMGLTAIGLAGVTLSYSGIAHTFVDGMHALTGLTMFVGLIFLSAGILDGGVSTSNRAKATTLVIISIALGFGTYAFTMNSSNYTVTLAGILMAIAFPAILIAYIAMKKPEITKPFGAIVAMAGATGIIMWIVFGFVSPDTYMIDESANITEPEAADVEQSGPIFAITILEGSAEQGMPDYEPDVANVPQGHVVEWTNVDTVAHTVTSSVDFGETFDSSLIAAGETYKLDTNQLSVGEYEYLCVVHPWMVSTLIVEEPKADVIVSIPDGAGIQQIGQIYYDPEVIQVPAGTKVIWENNDTTIHTVTSGTPNQGPDGLFDSGMIAAEDSFEYTFSSPGKVDYYCIVHPWMVGSVDVE